MLGTWTQVSGPSPSPRWGHTAVLDSKRHQILVFGGVGGGSEIWTFSLDSESWQEINPANGPSALSQARAIADPSHDRMVIVGGARGASVSNQVWSFNFATQTWSQLPTGPSPRFDLDAATDGKHAWFFGGFFPGFVATNELWQLDLSSDTWVLLPAGQGPPSPRTNAALGFLANSLYMTGGHDLKGPTTGTWRYDLNAQSWSQLMPTGAPGAGAHFGYDVDTACSSLVLAFGDHDDAVDVASTDLLSLSSSPQFSRLPATAVPPARRHAPLVFDPQTHELFTFGGLQGTTTVLNDTWIYKKLDSCQ